VLEASQHKATSALRIWFASPHNKLFIASGTNYSGGDTSAETQIVVVDGVRRRARDHRHGVRQLNRDDVGQRDGARRAQRHILRRELLGNGPVEGVDGSGQWSGR